MSDQCASPTIEERQADFIRAVKDGDRVTVSKVNAIGGWDSSHFNARDIQDGTDELDRLRAENERLREALEKIHQYAIVMPVSRLSLEKRGVWEMAIEGAAMHVQKAARAVILAKGDE